MNSERSVGSLSEGDPPTPHPTPTSDLPDRDREEGDGSFCPPSQRHLRVGLSEARVLSLDP